MMRGLSLAVFMVVLVSGCATGPTNLSPAELVVEPIVREYKVPDLEESERSTFAVFPRSAVDEKTLCKNRIVEKQLLFALRNALEERGYKFVKLEDSPDLLFSIDANSEYQETWVPPRQVTIPAWVPGKTITTFGTTSGSFSGGYGWGNYSGTYSESTYVPGYMTTETFTRPGYTAGAYYPYLVVFAYDPATGDNLWAGVGVGTSKHGDIRISSQLLLRMVLSKLPAPDRGSRGRRHWRKSTGMTLGVFTVDGNDYYPTVTAVQSGSPAAEAGIKLHDMLVSADGKSLKNKSLSELGPLLRFGSDGQIEFTIKRLDERFDVRVGIPNL